MTEQEYREALHEINVKAENERRVLARAFATEHSPVKVGDYISDHRNTIRVSECWEVVKSAYEYNSLPCIVYRGMTARRMARHERTRRGVASIRATFCE